jgi:hypothetical protein
VTTISDRFVARNGSMARIPEAMRRNSRLPVLSTIIQPH